jgi:hypothetical protein
MAEVEAAKPVGSLEVTQAADFVALWVTVDGKRFKLPMGPTYAANLGMELLAAASKAVNASTEAALAGPGRG